MAVLDALVAVGLAGNVVQFCQAAAEVITQTVTIRRSGQPSSLPEFKSHGEKATKLADLVKTQLSSGGQTVAQEDAYLLQLAAECQEAGTDFLDHLNTFKPPAAVPDPNLGAPGTPVPPNFIQSTAASVKFQWHHHKIMNFSNKLDRFRDVLVLSTLLALRAKTDSQHGNIVSHLKKMQAQADGNTTQLEQLTSMFQSTVKSDLNAVKVAINTCLEKINHVRLGLPQTRELAILRWLNFRQMTWRYEEVPVAFQKTFQWIFAGQANPRAVWDDFKDHLERNGIVDPYWIDGKAGSGKSTLMKFIVDSPLTMQSLHKWATNEELIVIKFFFWNLGTALQKSSVGMLRALILTVLDKNPELIPAVFPTLYQTWDDSDAKSEPSYIELKQAFALLVEKSSAFVKLCIFVDGIDEFEGDHKDISIFLRSLASAQVKVIVSSRPISACVNVFRGCPTLKLQDLTKDDMRIFVQGNLSSHRTMIELVRRFPKEARDIEEEIKEKATGVFLWVKIVVRMLVDGLEDGDNLSDLQRKLKTLPPDLRDLYQRMLGKMSQEYQIQAAELFQLFHTWNSLILDQPLQSLLLSFAVQAPSEVLYREIATMDRDEVKWRCDNVEARVRSRCCGLIEIHNTTVSHSSRNQWSNKPPDNEPFNDINDLVPIVDYLHRTVAEFLLADDVWQQICEMTKQSEFWPVLSMAYASLSVLKTANTHYKFKLQRHFQNTLVFCRENEFSDEKLEEFFTQVDRTMDQHVQYAIDRGWKSSTNFRPHWSTEFYPVDFVPKQSQQILTQHGNRFCVAARFSLVQYLKASGSCRSMNYIPRYAIVTHALHGWLDASSNISLHDLSDTLLYLLQNIARPEDVGLDGSLWQYAVSIGNSLAAQAREVHCAELLRVFLVTAHSRRALMLKKISTDGDKVQDPMSLIRRIKQNPVSGGYDHCVSERDISFLGDELERLAFSKLRTDDVSQRFLDIVARVCSMQRVARGGLDASTASRNAVMPDAQHIAPSMPRYHNFEPRAPQIGRGSRVGAQSSWTQHADSGNITHTMGNLSLHGQSGPSFGSLPPGVAPMNTPLSNFHAVPQYYTPTPIAPPQGYYHQAPNPPFIPINAQTPYPFHTPGAWPQPQYPQVAQPPFVNLLNPGNLGAPQGQFQYSERFNSSYRGRNRPRR